MPFDKGHALVIGIGKYEYVPRWNVPITARDAEAVASTLCDPRLCAYPVAQVRKLIGNEATRDGVLRELDDLKQRVTDDHTVLIFYAGHGEYSADGTYHLSTYDTKLTNERKITPGTAISHVELALALQQITAKRVLILFNACHSGELSPQSLGGVNDTDLTGQAPPASATSALLATGSGRIVITACREDQLSYVGSGHLTRSATAVIEGLCGRGDVGNRNGYISAYDLYLHTYYAVSDIARQHSQQQEPELTILKGVGPFAVALYKGTTVVGSFNGDERPPTEGSVREVSQTRSRDALTLIMSQAAGRDIVDVRGDFVKGDRIDARGSQGFINNSSGQVTQVFSTSRAVNTGGGDYAEGDIDKREQVSILSDQLGIPRLSTSDLNSKSLLANVSQSVESSGISPRSRRQIGTILDLLGQSLQQAPTTQIRTVELVAKQLEAMIDVAISDKHDMELFEFRATHLCGTAQILATDLPDVPLYLTQIIKCARKLAGFS